MGNGIAVNEPQTDVKTGEPRILPKNSEWGWSDESVEARGICDSCERYREENSGCYIARKGTVNDGLYTLGEDFVFLRCPAHDSQGNSMYRPIKIE